MKIVPSKAALNQRRTKRLLWQPHHDPTRLRSCFGAFDSSVPAVVLEWQKRPQPTSFPSLRGTSARFLTDWMVVQCE